MPWPESRIACGIVAVLVLLVGAPQSGFASGDAGEEAAWQALQHSGHAGLLRHAIAPGVSDGPDMDIGDCATQRNLEQQGREQAKAIGDRLRARGIDKRPVYTSRMCRAIDTAEHLDVGPVRRLPILDSYFDDEERKQVILEGIRTFLRTDALDPPPIMVTHTPNINELSGRSPDQGGMVVVRVHAGGSIEMVGEIPPPE